MTPEKVNGGSQPPQTAGHVSDAEGPDSPPFITLCVICGDVGAQVVERMLKSCLDRPTGPMFDEVSVYWNGTAEKKPKCLERPVWRTVTDFDVPMVVSDGPWRDDFAWARQISYEQAHGVWRFYADADDVFVPPEDAAVDEVLDQISETRTTSESSSLRTFLKHQPPAINALRMLYNYTTIEGKAALQIPRVRAVRWADGWVWKKDVHEDLFPIATTNVGLVHLTGLVIRHDPIEAGESRIARNQRILEKTLAALGGPSQADHRTLFGLAAIHFDHQNDPEACTYLEQALTSQIPPAPSPPEVALYRTMLAQSYTRMGDTQKAVQHGFLATLAQPDEPRGYLEVARALYHMGDRPNAVRWFRDGFARSESLGTLTQNPMAIKGQLRAIGAHALLALGQTAEAFVWAQMAAKADPGLFPEQTLKLCTSLLEAEHAKAAFHNLGTYLLRTGEMDRVRALIQAAPANIEDDPTIWNLRETVAAAEAEPPQENVEPLSNISRRSLQIPDGVDVVGPELVRTLDPASALAAAEAKAGGSEVHVVVQDGSASLQAPPTGAKVRYTAARLYRLLADRGTVKHLVSVEPARTTDIGSDRLLYARYSPGATTGRRVAIWSPHFAQQWGPNDPEIRGTGGSEEAILYLSRELARKGCRVEVYAPLPQMDLPLKVADGVLWRPLNTFDASTAWDHLLMHRAPWGPQVTRFGAKNVWTWHHDHFYSEEYWTARLAEKSRHLYVSRWQRRLLEGLLAEPGRAVPGSTRPSTKGVVIYNGIPPEQYVAAKRQLETATSGSGAKPKRYPRTVAYASMPTRGLDRLFAIWPDVRAAVPDAVLFFYYGMATARQLWRGHTADVFGKLTQLQQQMTKFQAEGSFVERGRVGQTALTAEFLQTGVLAYPTYFPEVYMISGVRATAAGMRVVYTDAGCLAETLPNQTYMVREAASDEAWNSGGRGRFTAMLIKALTDPEEAYDREAVAAAALEECAWSGVADRVLGAFAAAESGDEGHFNAVDEPFSDTVVPTGTAARIPKDPSIRKALEEESSVRMA